MQKTHNPNASGATTATRMGRQARRRGTVWLIPSAPQDEVLAARTPHPHTSGALALVAEPEPITTPLRSSSQTCVLIVEDDPHVSGLLRQALELEGHTDWSIDILTDGRTALHRAQTSAPKIILLDVRLPDMDGAEVYHRLRTNPATQACHVVFLTASTSLDLSLRGVDGGVLLRKPFVVDDVIALVTALVSES